MPKVFTIGVTLPDKCLDSLKKYGSIRTLKSIGNIHPDRDICLLIIDKNQRRDPSFKDFLKAFADVPKVIFSANSSFAGFAPWLKTQLAFPVHACHEKELLFLIDHLMSENSMRNENFVLRDSILYSKTVSGVLDDMGRVLASNMSPDQMLNAIMEKAKAATGASSWSVFRIDDYAGGLTLERTDKKTKKGRAVLSGLWHDKVIAGWAAGEGKPMAVPDISKDKRFTPPSKKARLPGSVSLISVPINSKGRVTGAIVFTGRTSGCSFTGKHMGLILKIANYVSIAMEEAALHRSITELAVTDDLTRLFNFRYLNRAIDSEINRCRRQKTSVSLIFTDIDDFKKINDKHGHLTGSRVLVEIGELLLKHTRSIDVVARYGGDEFVAVLPQTPPDLAAKTAERIRRLIEKNIFMKKIGCNIRITASFGVASYPESAKSREELLKRADEAMYKVKTCTKNGICAIV